jgi:hypothetical protein
MQASTNTFLHLSERQINANGKSIRPIRDVGTHAAFMRATDFS